MTTEVVDGTETTPAVIGPAEVVFLDRARLDLLKQTIATDLDDNEFALFAEVCNRTGLDPFMRQIHAVKRWNNRQGRDVMTIQVGIDGFRAIADRTGVYAGSEDSVFEGTVRAGSGKNEVDAPAKATATVWKIVGGLRVAFVASAHWSEYYPGDGGDGFMWRKMPHTMLGKTAEALALRKGFPSQLSGLYTNEEMAQNAATSEPPRTVEPQGNPPPEGFDSWDEYEGTYAEYRAAYQAANGGAQAAAKALIAQNGWKLPVTRTALDALLRVVGGVIEDAGGSPPDTDKGETSAPVDAAPSAPPSPEGPETGQESVAGNAGVVQPSEASGEAAQEQAEGDAEDGGNGDPEASAVDGGGGAAPVQTPPSPPSTPPAVVKSEPGQRSRLAAILRGVWPDKDQGDRARACVVDIVTSGHATSAKELGYDEAAIAIRLAKLLGSGHVVFGTFDADENVTTFAPGILPDAVQAATVVSAHPEGSEDAEAGDNFMDELEGFLA